MILLHRSIRVSSNTKQAWKDNDVYFTAPDRTNDWVKRKVLSGELEAFINYGNKDLAIFTTPEQTPVYNNGPSVVTRLIDVEATRAYFNDLMAPRSGQGEFVWAKETGRAGQGKRKVPTESLDLDSLNYWEDHVVGTEYRIITTGNKRVQQFIRSGDNNARIYKWLPMQRLPDSTKRTIKLATERLPKRSIIAWDIIDASETGGGSYILEGNTSPGVNRNTARRILDQIRKDNN